MQAKTGMLRLAAPAKNIPSMQPVPSAPWFLAVFVRDVMTRLDEVKAKITSTFGTVLKLDSTKKVGIILKFIYTYIEFIWSGKDVR